MENENHSDGRIVIESNITVSDELCARITDARSRNARRELRLRIGDVVFPIACIVCAVYVVRMMVARIKEGNAGGIIACAVILALFVLMILLGIRSKRRAKSKLAILEKEAAEYPADILRYHRTAFGNDGITFTPGCDKANFSRISELLGEPYDETDDWVWSERYCGYDELDGVLECESGLFIYRTSDDYVYIPARFISAESRAEISRRLENAVPKKKYTRIGTMITSDAAEKSEQDVSASAGDRQPLAQIEWKRGKDEYDRRTIRKMAYRARPGYMIAMYCIAAVEVLYAAYIIAVIAANIAGMSADEAAAAIVVLAMVLIFAVSLLVFMDPVKPAKKQLEAERIYGGRAVLYEDAILVRHMGDDVLVPYDDIHRAADAGGDTVLTDRVNKRWLITAIPSDVLDANSEFKAIFIRKFGESYKQNERG